MNGRVVRNRGAGLRAGQLEKETTVDYLQYYGLESYLFEKVQPRFAGQGYLSAFDFFCIIIWKANRAKSTTANRIKRDSESLDATVRDLTSGLSEQSTNKERMGYLFGSPWRFALPMASAILTVLYPNEFTVYDVRVCSALKDIRGADDFKGLADKPDFEAVWQGYEQFVAAVKSTSGSQYSLRDKDRNLWGRSFCAQLERDIAARFEKPMVTAEERRD